eukprot:scaffold2658_cov246-Pinguiococcus_pyrenoidosus.AAC.6
MRRSDGRPSAAAMPPYSEDLLSVVSTDAMELLQVVAPFPTLVTTPVKMLSMGGGKISSLRSVAAASTSAATSSAARKEMIAACWCAPTCAQVTLG